jgi:amino acid transporter
MSQELFVALNLLANGSMFIELLVFIYFIFGRADSVAHRFPLITHWAIKIGLCVMCAGSLFAFLKELEDLHSSIAIWQQLLRNIGCAIIFGWAVLFHWKYFIVNKQVTKVNKSPKKKAVAKKTAKIEKKLKSK